MPKLAVFSGYDPYMVEFLVTRFATRGECRPTGPRAGPGGVGATPVPKGDAEPRLMRSCSTPRRRRSSGGTLSPGAPRDSALMRPRGERHTPDAARGSLRPCWPECRAPGASACLRSTAPCTHPANDLLDGDILCTHGASGRTVSRSHTGKPHRHFTWSRTGPRATSRRVVGRVAVRAALDVPRRAAAGGTAHTATPRGVAYPRRIAARLSGAGAARRGRARSPRRNGRDRAVQESRAQAQSRVPHRPGVRDGGPEEPRTSHPLCPSRSPARPTTPARRTVKPV